MVCSIPQRPNGPSRPYRSPLNEQDCRNQKAPSYLNRDASIARAVERVDQAAAGGARLVVFTGHSFPDTRHGSGAYAQGSDWGHQRALHKRLLENAVDLPSLQLDAFDQAAGIG